MNFGKALKTIRLMLRLDQKEAARLAYMDERTFRGIEANRNRLSAEQVEMFAGIYRVSIQLIYDMARTEVQLQNIVYEAKRDGIVVNQGQEIEKGVLDHLMSRLEGMEARLKVLEVDQN